MWHIPACFFRKPGSLTPNKLNHKGTKARRKETSNHRFTQMNTGCRGDPAGSPFSCHSRESGNPLNRAIWQNRKSVPHHKDTKTQRRTPLFNTHTTPANGTTTIFLSIRKANALSRIRSMTFAEQKRETPRREMGNALLAFNHEKGHTCQMCRPLCPSNSHTLSPPP